MKKLINGVNDVVREALEGMAAAHSDLISVHFDPDFIVRAGGPVPGKVAIVSGGGSGHEPLHGGFVGVGMLDAACPGPVFTSPTADQVQAATKAVDGGAGVLHIVKNYTGDVLNFEIAAELAAASGIEVRSVVIDDDCAVKDSLYTAGRRGVAGTVLAEKICGAAAERKSKLVDIADLCERVNNSVRTMGAALSSCTVPHVGHPTFSLGETEMEIGVGIHGEPGRYRMALEPADAIVGRLVDAIVEDLPFCAGDQVLLFVNGMGGTPLIELYVAYRSASRLLRKRGIDVVRSLVGNYVTSLEMAGVSISVLRLDQEMTELWDAPVNTAALRKGL